MMWISIIGNKRDVLIAYYDVLIAYYALRKVLSFNTMLLKRRSFDTYFRMKCEI